MLYFYKYTIISICDRVRFVKTLLAICIKNCYVLFVLLLFTVNPDLLLSWFYVILFFKTWNSS